MAENCIEIKNLSKSFGEGIPKALDNITAVIREGEMTCLAGPDGAGKTTLIRLIAGLMVPTQGQISVFGYDTVKDAEELHAFMGYMPQKFGLYEDLTVMQNLNLFADLKDVIGEEREEAYARLLGMFDLAPFVDRLAGALSGGMKQKLGLACTLLRKPRFLLLDEPSVGVDPVSRREIFHTINTLLSEGVPVIWSTAYLDEVERAHSVLLLNEGKLLYDGNPRGLNKRVEGRTFLLTNIKGDHRAALTFALQQDNVVDGIIQGSDLRIVSKIPEKEPFSPNAFPLETVPTWKPVTPRFEDAFVDILGGGPKGESPLTQKYPPKTASGGSPIQAIKLTKRFGNFTAANEITFEVKPGEIFGLLGPNGAGKSTTFKMLCGLLTPTSGQALVTGLDLQVATGKARRKIGYMAQKFSLYGNLSVYQNLTFFSGLYNLLGPARWEAIRQMVDLFSLKPYLHAPAETLPLGFKQRLALACSLMHKPDILFLDEPTSGVDPITRREFWGHINGLVKKGVTVMVTTHFMEEAEYCDRIALIYKSRMIRMGHGDELKAEVRTAACPNPTLEDAFIYLIEQYDHEQRQKNAP